MSPSSHAAVSQNSHPLMLRVIDDCAPEAHRFASVADAAPAMIWRAGPDQLCDYFNRTWLDYRGRTLDQEVGHGWFEGVHPEDQSCCCRARENGFQEHRSFQVEYRLRRYDGVYRWILETAAPWFWPTGTFRGHVGSCVDIHERKLGEENLQHLNSRLQAQNEELTEFAYAASHDLQEPLRTIAAFAQLLTRQDDNLEDRESLLTILLGSVQRMQVLVHDLLDYSQVIHRSELRMVELDANVVVEQVLFACQAAIKESGAVITRDALPDVQADEAQLVRVLQNLISNAIKYRRQDERLTVHISAAVDPEEWRFEVADNGIGFEPQYSEQIFGLFKRLHNKAEYSGSGIGLAICRKIVERHGGRIWAESNVGHGSQFFFTLRRP